MSWAQNTKFRLQVTCIALAVMCPVGLILMAGSLRRQHASSSWPTVEGVVLNTVIKPWTDSDGDPTYFGRAEYSYAVDGKPYTSDLTDLGPGAKRKTQSEAHADVAQYRQGKKVTVYYDPADPQTGILEPGVPSHHMILMSIMLVGMIACPIPSVLIIRGWLSKERN